MKQVNMMTLAEHIIEATPERIKRENFTAADSVPLDTSGVSNTMNWLANYLGDVEQLPSIIHLRWGELWAGEQQIHIMCYFNALLHCGIVQRDPPQVYYSTAAHAHAKHAKWIQIYVLYLP